MCIKTQCIIVGYFISIHRSPTLKKHNKEISESNDIICPMGLIDIYRLIHLNTAKYFLAACIMYKVFCYIQSILWTPPKSNPLFLPTQLCVFITFTPFKHNFFCPFIFECMTFQWSTDDLLGLQFKRKLILSLPVTFNCQSLLNWEVKLSVNPPTPC